MHLSRRIQIAYLKVDETPTKVFSKYTDFADLFSLKLAVKLFKHISIKDYVFKLVDVQQPL